MAKQARYLNHLCSCKHCFFETNQEVNWESEDIESYCPLCGRKTIGKVCKVKISVELKEEEHGNK